MTVIDSLHLSNVASLLIRALASPVTHRRLLKEAAEVELGQVEPTEKWTREEMKVYQAVITIFLAVG